MCKPRFTEYQIICILKSVKAGRARARRSPGRRVSRGDLVFRSLKEVREVTNRWLIEYNKEVRRADKPPPKKLTPSTNLGEVGNGKNQGAEEGPSVQ